MKQVISGSIIVPCKMYTLRFTTISDKKKEKETQHVELSERSQVMDQFHLYRFKGMSVTSALHATSGRKCVKENWPQTKLGSNCKVT